MKVEDLERGYRENSAQLDRVLNQFQIACGLAFDLGRAAEAERRDRATHVR